MKIVKDKYGNNVIVREIKLSVTENQLRVISDILEKYYDTNYETYTRTVGSGVRDFVQPQIDNELDEFENVQKFMNQHGITNIS